MDSKIDVRIDEELKKDFTELAKSYDLSVSEAVRNLLESSLLVGKISNPYEIEYDKKQYALKSIFITICITVFISILASKFIF